MKDSVASPGLSDFLTEGKIDNDVLLSDQHVTGICLMYPTRSAQEHEFMIREKSIVPLNGGNLSECVQQAKELAFSSAVGRLAQVLQFPVPGTFHDTESAPAPDAPKPVQAAPASPAGTEKNAAQPPVPKPEENTPEPVSTPPTVSPGEDGENKPADNDNTPLQGDNPEPPADENTGSGSTVEKLNLGLAPASSLMGGKPEETVKGPASPDDAFLATVDDPAKIKAAMDMPITILGKLHECSGMKAGEILNHDPEIIVDFAKRYHGPRVEEKEALELLYAEAVRRVNMKNAA